MVCAPFYQDRRNSRIRLSIWPPQRSEDSPSLFAPSFAPHFANALQRGECAFAYVSGLNKQSDPQLPLLANAFTESLGIYTTDPSQKGGVFSGESGLWITAGGSAKASDLSGDFRCIEFKNGKKTDVFSKEWGTNPDNIRNPEG